MKNKNSKGFARSVGVRLFAAALGSVALGGATLGCGDEDTAADDENDTLTDVVKDTDSDK